MMAAGVALDPTFGSNGVVLGPVLGSGPILSNTASVLMRPDGEIVTIGVDPATTNGPISIRRYNANGSADTTFGTNGQLNIPLANYPVGGDLTGTGAALAPDGSIAFVASIGSGYAADGTTLLKSARSVIFDVTSSGQVNAAFGQNGQATIGLAGADFTDIAVQADGKIVAAGTSTSANPPSFVRDNQISVVRLTTTGALDPTFNGTGILATVPGSLRTSSAGVNGVAVTASGQILVAGAGQDMSVEPHLFVARLRSDGAIDPTFGSAGSVTIPDSYLATGLSAAFSTDGKIVLPAYQNFPTVGESSFRLVRLLANGTIDPTFEPFTPLPAAPVANQYDNPRTLAVATDGTITIAGVAGTQHALLLDRFLPDGAVDLGFGVRGRAAISIPATIDPTMLSNGGLSVRGVVVTPTGQIVVAGDQYGGRLVQLPDGPQQVIDSSQFYLARLTVTPTTTITPTAGDYDGDGKSDIAAELEAFGLFAIRQSSGKGDLVEPFGPAGLGDTIPAPGDYDGDGKTDIAAYLPAYGVLAYRPSSGGADVIVPFGIPGAGQSIPAPGDYDGDGKTDVAVYLPTLGILAYRPSSGGADVLEPFGIAGAGQSIPAPGDYDGLGKTDVAVYLPALAILAYRPSNGAPDVLVPFGIPGAGQSIPAPGDYDGDGKTDVAVYLPALGDFAYRPSGGGADVIEQFGVAGTGQSIPAPGDYDGDGKTDIAIYLPHLSDFAYRPSSGGADVIEQFGAVGTGETVPASSIFYGQLTQATIGHDSTQAVAAVIPPTDEVMGPIAGSGHARKKHRARSL